MYQSIRIPQLVFSNNRAPQHHLHDKKGHLQLATKLPKRFFFFTSWISSKINRNEKENVLPTLIQFHVHRTGIVEVTFNKNSENVWHQTCTSLQLLEQDLQLVLDQLIFLALHSGHLPNTL